MNRRGLGGVTTALVLLLTACGPRPVVGAVSSRTGPHGRLDVEVVLDNSGGEGQVALELELHDPDTGALVLRETREAELRAGPSQRVILPVELPAAWQGRGESLRCRVEARYPVE